MSYIYHPATRLWRVAHQTIAVVREDCSIPTQLSMIYTKVNKLKAAKLCKDRSIFVLYRKPTRLNYIETLRNADKFCAFRRFLDLPPEQRTTIY